MVEYRIHRIRFHLENLSMSVFLLFKNHIKDDNERIKSISSFVGSLNDYLLNEHFTDCDLKGIEINKWNVNTTFIASGVSPDLDTDDHANFEKSFQCKILFFLKSQRTGNPILRVVEETISPIGTVAFTEW
ncbi:hypothetical protein ACOME3_010147 [Neoechinorhynchus agilis]